MMTLTFDLIARAAPVIFVFMVGSGLVAAYALGPAAEARATRRRLRRLLRQF